MRAIEDIRRLQEECLKSLEEEANKPYRVYPCKKCRWYALNKIKNYLSDTRDEMCTQPLIIGFDTNAVRIGRRTFELCGPEKALWEEKTPLQKVLPVRKVKLGND